MVATLFNNHYAFIITGILLQTSYILSKIFITMYIFFSISFLIYMVYYYTTYKFYIFHKKKSAKKDSIIIMVIFSILVPVNFYSGVFGSTDALYLFALLPYLQLDNNKNV